MALKAAERVLNERAAKAAGGASEASGGHFRGKI